MLDTTQNLMKCAEELGAPVEQLLTPLTRYLPQQPEAHFAIDNGAFSKTGFKKNYFLNLLKREEGRKKLCRFVAVPDVVGSARRTLEAFDHWRDQHALHGWPLALVAQDGQEDLPIDWASIAAIFIGGSTKWKMSKAAADIVRTAKLVGCWAHIGRVNDPGRWEYFEQLGADSFDGTGVSRYTWMREAIYRKYNEPTLFDAIDAVEVG